MKQFQFFVIFSCAVLSATAAPQGYKYQQNGPIVQNGNLRPQTPLSPSGIFNVPVQQTVSVQNVGHPVITTVAGPQFQQQQQQQLTQSHPLPQLQQSFVPAAPQQQQFVASQPQQQQQQQQIVQTIQQTQPIQQQVLQSQYVQRPAIITKDIYIHSAPDETEDISASGPQLDNVPIRKNYRIVFIKAPTQNLKQTAAALKRAQASNEEKTVIYVLSKKPDITEIQQQLQVTQNEAKVHKPEVYFIKYKTTEEAQRAQQEIQAQYDALGGATHISDEGVAPISSFSDGSLNLGNIVPHHVQAQTTVLQQHHQQQHQQQPQSQTLFQSSQSVPLLGQGLVQQQQTSFSQQTNSYGNSIPSKKYLPAKAFK